MIVMMFVAILSAPVHAADAFASWPPPEPPQQEDECAGELAEANARIVELEEALIDAECDTVRDRWVSRVEDIVTGLVVAGVLGALVWLKPDHTGR